ncbi:MAG: GNAT family N-acetyltransferase [Ilumatobacteraceae bacterium]
MALTMEHDEAGHRYVLRDDGTEVTSADYRPLDGGRSLMFHHTLTLPRHRGHGYAAELVRRALDDVRAHDRTVVATCWFVDEFIDSSPEYADLRA